MYDYIHSGTFMYSWLLNEQHIQGFNIKKEETNKMYFLFIYIIQEEAIRITIHLRNTRQKVLTYYLYPILNSISISFGRVDSLPNTSIVSISFIQCCTNGGRYALCSIHVIQQTLFIYPIPLLFRAKFKTNCADC